MADLGAAQNGTLEAYQEYVRQVMAERGFDDEIVSQKFMLLLEEAGGFARAARKRANLAGSADNPPERLDDAAADVFIILLDLCNQLGLDLEKAFIAREQRNQSRRWQ